MKIVYGFDAPDLEVDQSVLLIGNFDGVHRGHQRLLARGASLAKDANVRLVMLTFEPHPLAILRPQHAPERLMTLSGKLARLERCGVDTVVVAASTADFLGLEAERFIELVVDRLHPIHIVEGTSFGFGRGRKGTPELLQSLGRRHGFDVCIIDSVTLDLVEDGTKVSVPVSSSVVRKLIARGDVHQAGLCLGQSYELLGCVMSGAGRGKAMGFPTANVGDIDQLIPGDGVYAGRVSFPDATGGDLDSVVAGISIGTNPTFGGSERRVEAHLIGFQGDVLGRPILLKFGKWLRGQRKFDSGDALVAQIAADIEAVREWGRT